jgi:MFS family permease
VAILVLAYACAGIDRLIIGLMVPALHRDLGLSDFEISLLQGLAFVVPYVAMSALSGAAADRWPRKWVVIAGILVWGAMTAACGLASSFALLLVARMGVGAGESALTPASYSMIGDLFPPERTAVAFSVFQLGAYLGAGGGYIFGGLIIGLASALHASSQGVLAGFQIWQIMFLLAAIPALMVVPIFAFTVREPKRHSGHAASSADDGFTLFLKRNAVLLGGLLGATALLGLIGYGVISWTPVFFLRRFGWSPGAVGLLYGTVLLVGGSLGSLAGGQLAHRFGTQDLRPLLRITMVGIAGTAGFGVIYPLMPGAVPATTALFGTTFFMSLPSTVVPTIIRLIAANQYRGRVAAIHIFGISVIGGAGGPMAVAAFTDFVFRDPSSVHLSIIAVTAISGVIALLLLRAAMRAVPASSSDQRA